MKTPPPMVELRTDIAEISAAAQPNSALSKATALQNAFQDPGDLAIIATDEKGIVQVFNAGAERLLGYTAAEAVDKLSLSDFQDPQDAFMHAKALSAELGTMIAPGFGVLTAKASRGIESRHRLICVRKDGSRLTALVAITALHDDRGRIKGYLLIGTIISTPERAVEAAAANVLQAVVENCRKELAPGMLDRTSDLWDSGELFRQIATNIPEALWIQDVGAKTLRYINPGWEKMTGRSVAAGDDVHRLYETLHPDDVQRVLDCVTELPNGGANLECRIVMPDGILRWVHMRTFPIADSVGKVYRVAGFLDDITAQKEESERVERLKDDFVSTVSHELRTPLTSIVGSLGLLVDNAAGKLPDSAVRLIKIAHSNSERLVRLIGDILDIEKLESGKIVFDLDQVEVRSLVRQSIDAISGFAQSCGVRVRLDDCSVSGEVCADPDRLVQVLTNLLSNAIKFSPEGEEVVVDIKKRRDMVNISIRDHGCGIPDTFKPRIFEKFSQADATDTRKMGGTGLGLSIVQKIVARLDGEVGFNDAPGGGTIFYVELPDWDHLGKTKSDQDRRSDSPRILLCEDDAEVAIVLRERLWQAGFATDLAYTASEAAERAGTMAYAAILVDLQRPDGDGISLIKKLRAQPQRYNTLMVVASADPNQTRDSSKSCAMLNIVDLLEKPIELDRLVRVIDRLVVPGIGTLSHILHVDDDHDMVRVGTQTLDSAAEIMSVGSTDEARRALAANRFDVAVLNVALASGTGLDLLLELKDLDGDAIPVIVLSTLDADTQYTSRHLCRAHQVARVSQ